MHKIEQFSISGIFGVRVAFGLYGPCVAALMSKIESEIVFVPLSTVQSDTLANELMFIDIAQVSSTTYVT